MQTGSAKTWCDYIVALMFKVQQSFTTSDELLREINQKFGDTDKRTTQSLKIRTGRLLDLILPQPLPGSWIFTRLGSTTLV